MNGYRARIALILVFWLTAKIHGMAMPHVPNLESFFEGANALVFYGGAGAVDWFLLFSAPWFISGRLCDDIQASCIASIVVNFAGLCAYMADTPPSLYQTLIVGLAYAQYLRILYMGRTDADFIERAVVPDAHRVGA